MIIRATRLARLGSRLITSASSPPAVLVGAPDVLSNLRPAIYDGVWFKAVSEPLDPSYSSTSPLLPTPTLVHPDKETDHPYALNEFPQQQGVGAVSFFEEKQEWALQYRLLKQSLDAFNHAFWTDTNTRFNTYKHFVENSTKTSQDYIEGTAEIKEQMLEMATAGFYRVWQENEARRQKAYTVEMYRRTFGVIWFGVRFQMKKVAWAVRSFTNRDLL